MARLISRLRDEIAEAETRGEKVVTFAYSIVTNYDALSGYDKRELALALGMNATYHIEINKLFNLCKMLRANGKTIS